MHVTTDTRLRNVEKTKFENRATYVICNNAEQTCCVGHDQFHVYLHRPRSQG